MAAKQPDPTTAAMLAAAYGVEPNLWESAAHNKVPDSAWEYHMRKQLNDAAYNNLDYVPYCSTMPVPPKCDEPKWAWKKKERH